MTLKKRALRSNAELGALSGTHLSQRAAEAMIRRSSVQPPPPPEAPAEESVAETGDAMDGEHETGSGTHIALAGGEPLDGISEPLDGRAREPSVPLSVPLQ